MYSSCASLQELPTDDGAEAGRVPRTLECELTSDLVDSCVPGDVVTVCGVVKVISADGEQGIVLDLFDLNRY